MYCKDHEHNRKHNVGSTFYRDPDANAKAAAALQLSQLSGQIGHFIICLGWSLTTEERLEDFDIKLIYLKTIAILTCVGEDTLWANAPLL